MNISVELPNFLWQALFLYGFIQYLIENIIFTYLDPETSTVKTLPIIEAPTEKEIVEKASIENTPTNPVETEAGRL